MTEVVVGIEQLLALLQKEGISYINFLFFQTIKIQNRRLYILADPTDMCNKKE